MKRLLAPVHRFTAGLRHLVCATVLAALLLAGSATPARACPCMTLIGIYGSIILAMIEAEQDAQRDNIDRSFEAHRLWMIEVYFREYILRAMMMVTEQLTVVAMHQMMILGAFFDAKHQLETERLFATLTARAQKDYHPSDGLCTIGSGMKTLAASGRNAELTAHLLAQRSIDRQMINSNASSSDGARSDLASRIAQFRETYCDPNDNNRQLETICVGTMQQARWNRDIDFGRTVGDAMTLNINFSNGAVTDDETDVLALMSYLYAHKTFEPIAGARLRIPGKWATANRQLLIDMRSIVAKRSVAEQPFHAIVGMKTSSTSNASGPYLQQIMQELGVPQEEARRIVGDNPSYYAQMEMLTKRVLQRPDFFIDLYDKPANVARKIAAIQGLGLIQKRDLYKSQLRNEAIMAVLLELELTNAQRTLQDKFNTTDDTRE